MSKVSQKLKTKIEPIKINLDRNTCEAIIYICICIQTKKRGEIKTQNQQFLIIPCGLAYLGGGKFKTNKQTNTLKLLY